MTTCVPRFLFSERGFQRLIDFEHIREDDLCTAPGNGKDFAGVFSDIRNDTVVQTDGFCFFVDVSRQVGCGDRAHILDEEGGIPAQHGAEADGVAAAIFFDFGLRDLLVFFVARGNGDKPVDRRIFGIRKGEKAGAAVGNAVDGVFVLLQLVIRKINVILVGKKIKLCVRHKEPPINGEPRLSTRLREHFCPDHLSAAYRGAAVFVIPTIYQPHIGERALF